MYYMTLQDLIEEVNRVVKLPNQEDMKVALIRHVIAVYRKVKLIEPLIMEVMTVDTKNKTIILPEATYKVYDIGYGGADMFDTGLMRFRDRVTYRVHGNKIRFNQDEKSVSVAFLKLPQDDNGEILIDERIYDACVSYCIGQELLVKGANVKQDYATMNPAMTFIQQGRSLIDEARANMNETSPGEYRSLQEKLRRDY